MPLQKATDTARQPAAPQRRRGHERVAAIIEAAVALFAVREYSAVTMTEIAERSGTAIGSLYRFFPTKKHVADKILVHYRGLIEETFAACAQFAADHPIEATTQELIRCMTSLGRYRTAGLALVDALERSGQPNTPAHRDIRQAVRDGIARVLHIAYPNLPPAVVAERAWAGAALIKGANIYLARPEVPNETLARELAQMLALYFSQPAPSPGDTVGQ